MSSSCTDSKIFASDDKQSLIIDVDIKTPEQSATMSISMFSNRELYDDDKTPEMKYSNPLYSLYIPLDTDFSLYSMCPLNQDENTRENLLRRTSPTLQSQDGTIYEDLCNLPPPKLVRSYATFRG